MEVRSQQRSKKREAGASVTQIEVAGLCCRAHRQVDRSLRRVRVRGGAVQAGREGHALSCGDGRVEEEEEEEMEG